jgi:hypothetical protein
MIKWNLSLRCKDGSTYTNQYIWYTTLTAWKTKQYDHVNRCRKVLDKMQHSFIYIYLNNSFLKTHLFSCEGVDKDTLSQSKLAERTQNFCKLFSTYFLPATHPDLSLPLSLLLQSPPTFFHTLQFNMDFSFPGGFPTTEVVVVITNSWVHTSLLLYIFSTYFLLLQWANNLS